MPTDHIVHTLIVTALLWYSFEGFGNDKPDIIRNKCQRIHGSYINTSIPTVIIHDMTDLIRNFRSGIRHSRRHQTGIIGLDLVIQVIRMRVIQPMTGSRRHDTLQNIIPCSLVGMPQHISGFCKCHRKRIDRCIQSQTVEDIHKGQVHIDIIIQTGIVLIPPFDIAVRPGNRDIILYHRPVITKLRRSSVRTTDRLSGPSSFDFIHQLLLTDGYFRR